MKTTIIVLSMLFISISLMAQRAPNCHELEVTDMEYDQTTGKDTLYVTVYNDCDMLWSSYLRWFSDNITWGYLGKIK